MYAMYLYLYPWCSVVGIIKAREAAVLKIKKEKRNEPGTQNVDRIG